MCKPPQRHLQALCLAGLLISGDALSAAHTCADCHSSVTPSSNDLIQPLSKLCADCHMKRLAEGEHVVDIPANIPSNTLPLQNGQVYHIRAPVF